MVLTLSFLGPFRAELAGQPLLPFRTNKMQALLIYLAAESVFSENTVFRRDALMELLWPETPEASARQNLRQTLYLLRQALDRYGDRVGSSSAPLLLSDRQMVQLNPDAGYQSDIDKFQRLLAEGTIAGWEQAVSLYRGEFLSDFFVPDSNEFEVWAAAHRARLQRQVLDLLESLARHCVDEADYERAEQYIRRQLELDELHEEAHRQLMEVQVLSGQRVAALLQYEKLCVLLEEELGVAPTAETQRLIEAIRSDRLQPDAQPAKRIRGYDLREMIGEGSFALVYRAFQPAVGREVAVKTIHRRYVDEPEFIRRFEREARLVARLEHPHIVPLYDYWREPGAAYLVMRLIAGGSLEERLRGDSPWPADATVRLVEQICSALAVAHQQGVVHRDIKPANILLDQEGNAYLTDFGIAKSLSVVQTETQNGAFVGSPYYSSPEQLMGEPVSPQSDLYSLGLVIYELLAGQKPFPGEPLGQLLSQKLSGELSLAYLRQLELPPAVEQAMLQALAVRPEDRFSDAMVMATALREAIQGNGFSYVRSNGGREVYSETPNPYKGLRPFEEGDARYFFGREVLTKRLVERMGNSRFLAVVGPSGSGKSSVVKAGLLPALRAGAVSGSDRWFISEMVPGAEPLLELEAALLRIAIEPPDTLLPLLREDEHGLVRAVGQSLPTNKSIELLLVVDQFEELFTLVDDENTRQHFLRSLLAAVHTPNSRILVVITLRADFYDRPLLYQAFGELIEAHTQVVVPPSREELAQAIRGPAAKVGVGVEEALLERLVTDVYDQPGALPLLQYALTELFEQRESNLLTLKQYTALGRLAGALTGRAEALYQELDATNRTLARQFFMRLVVIGEEKEVTRRRVLRSELRGLLDEGNRRIEANGAHLSAIDTILDKYGWARLLSFDSDPMTREPTVEVAHEALLGEWPRLREWLDESRENIYQQQRLAAFTQEWLESGRDAGYLLSGSRLDQFSGWAASSDVALTREEQSFLTASLTAREDRLAQELARRREAERQAQLAFARELAAASLVNVERDPELSILLALESLGQVHTYEGENALHRAIITSPLKVRLKGHTAPVYSAAFSPNGKILATAGGVERTCRLWDVRTGNLLHTLRGHSAAVSVTVFSPDGEIVASAGDDGTVRLWNSSIGKLLDVIAITGKWVIDVAFSRDGTYLVAGTSDGVVKAVDVATGGTRFQLDAHEEGVFQLAFSADGTVLGSGDMDRTVKLWRAADGEPLRTLPQAGNGIRFSPQGKYLATYKVPEIAIWDLQDVLTDDGATPLLRLHGVRAGSGTAPFTFASEEQLVSITADNSIRVWESSSGAELLELISSVEGPLNLAASPDGGRVAVTGESHDVEICELALGFEKLTLQAHNHRVFNISFNRGGSRLYSAGWDGMIGVWNVDPESSGFGGRVLTTGDGKSLYYSALVDPSGKRLVASNRDGLIVIFDEACGEELLQLRGHTSAVRAFDFSPDGARLLSAGTDGTIIMWDIGTGLEIQRFTGHRAQLYNVVWTQDGSLFISSGDDCKAIIWDAASGKPLAELLHEHWVHALAISPDGQMLATGGNEGVLRLWDIAASTRRGEGCQRLAIKAHPHFIGNVAFSPDGKLLASASMEKRAKVWDVETGQERLTLTGADGAIWCVAFTPDGRYLATSSWDGRVRFYLLDLGELVELARERVTRELTPEERRRYLHVD